MLQRRRRELGQTSGVFQFASRVRGTGKVASQAIRQRKKSFAVFVLVVLGAVAWPFTKAHLQAVAVLRLVSGQPVPWIITELVAEPVRTEDVQFATDAGVVQARLYLPVRHPEAPGLVVLHGVHHLGIEEPRLVSFAAAMASCGVRVLTPQLPGIADYHVDRSSVRVIGESARWFAGQMGGPVGVLGLSFSGGLATGGCGRSRLPAGLQVCVRGRLAGCDGPCCEVLPDGAGDSSRMERPSG
jgi:hypothetical protein